ncbi:MAG: hypothetical protein ACQEQL_01415 [Pseudomonadota bacterium]
MKNITPENFMCHTSSCCPAVYETEVGSYVIVGKKLSTEAQNAIADRIGDDEYAIEVEKGMIKDIK